MSLKFHTFLTILLTTLHLTTIHSLNLDGTSLLSLKYSIQNDPTSVLTTWDYLDENPCSWTGILCDNNSNVVTLSLPNKQLLGSIPPDIGLMLHLQNIDLSNNFLNGTLPKTLCNSTNNSIRVLSLSSNNISGNIFDTLNSNSSITVLNISNNKFTGSLPLNFSEIFNNLTVLSLKGNYFTGNVPSGFPSTVQKLDISSNLLNGTIPKNLRIGSSLNYLNFSYNKISGNIPVEFGSTLLENTTIDLSYNNLTGEIPGLKVLQSQNPGFFSGNRYLCGKPLKNLCVIPSTFSNPPNITSISPAIAVIPIPVGSDSGSSSANGYGSGSGNSKLHSGLKPAAIVGITLADLAGVAILGAVFLYFYQVRKRKNGENVDFVAKKASVQRNADNFTVQISAVSLEPKNTVMHTKCLSKCLTGNGNESEGSVATESRNSSESEDGRNNGLGKERKNASNGGGGELVMVDGETEMEVETLLKASAYILGASGTSIVYKAVLQDGTTFAVRRLGEIGCDKLKDFDGHVKAIAKVKHPNLVRLRGFYWASDEKLVIYDYISNGSLATSAQKKSGSTPYNLPLEARLRIARGLARGLSHIHEKRLVHANIKPSNILLTPEMEPVISDLGLSWLVYGNNSSKGSGSARQFGSKRSMGSYDGTQDLSISGSPYINPFGGTNGAGSPYHAPESLKNLKPNPKWDVYSFGIVLLELLTGKVYLDRDLGQWTPSSGLEDRYWVLRIADVALRAEIQGKEDAMTSIFKLGFNCASLAPQKRPSMKDALQILEKVSLSFV